jgi:pimeloyl-ACP methyl ester carboxylesterase
MVPLASRSGMADVPEIRYARTADGVHIAYQEVGDGPPDVVYANSFVSHIEVSWEYPRAARFYERMASFCRLVLFDRRGTGLSDPIVESFTMEDRIADIAAVLDAIGLERAVLLGSSEGAAACAYFTALHPDRVSALILFSSFLTGLTDDDYPWGLSQDFIDLFDDAKESMWTLEEAVTAMNPSIADDAEACAWYTRYFRLSASPSLARMLMRHNLTVDIRPVLPTIDVPTLVLHRSDEAILNIEWGRYAARMIPGARLVELPGTDHFLWEQDSEAIVEEIEEFLTGVRRGRATERSLKTLLFTDIVGSTDRAHRIGDEPWLQLLDRQDAAVRRQLTRFQGNFVKSTGDGMLATFDGPAAAIRCALAIREAMRGLDLEVRAGVHSGEVELRGHDLGGIAVHIAARVADAADAGEVLISRTVADLIAGSGVKLTDRGEHDLKGVPDRWRLFAVDL